MSEKTIQITLSQLEALLYEQRKECAKIAEYYETWQLLNAPTPDLSHLKEVKNDVTNDKGMKWVKASERPIPSNPDTIIRRISTKEVFPYEWVNACINVGTWVEGKYSPSDYEWLDESAEGQQLTEKP
jgi:hypothetical protein